MSDHGGPAFPQVKTEWRNSNFHNTFSFGGMSLRDYFAAMAMQAMLSPNHPWGGEPERAIPRAAYRMADAMIKAREDGK